MSTAPVRTWREREDRLLRIRLSRPKANVLDAEMVAALGEAFSHADRPAPGAPALRGILLDAEGPHFSFGASVEEHLPDRCAAMLKGFHALVLQMIDLTVPILVAVKGQCLGGGLEVAAAGHVVFAAPDAKMGQPEITLGVFAPAASCILPERMGQGPADDLLLSGRSVDGAEALRLGIVNAVAPDPEAAALAYWDAHLAGRSASSLGYALRAARLGFAERVRAKLAAVEQLYLVKLMQTRDPVEGLKSFLEKRPPRWEDR